MQNARTISVWTLTLASSLEFFWWNCDKAENHRTQNIYFLIDADTPSAYKASQLPQWLHNRFLYFLGMSKPLSKLFITELWGEKVVSQDTFAPAKDYFLPPRQDRCCCLKSRGSDTSLRDPNINLIRKYCLLHAHWKLTLWDPEQIAKGYISFSCSSQREFNASLTTFPISRGDSWTCKHFRKERGNNQARGRERGRKTVRERRGGRGGACNNLMTSREGKKNFSKPLLSLNLNWRFGVSTWSAGLRLCQGLGTTFICILQS